MVMGLRTMILLAGATMCAANSMCDGLSRLACASYPNSCGWSDDDNQCELLSCSSHWSEVTCVNAPSVQDGKSCKWNSDNDTCYDPFLAEALATVAIVMIVLGCLCCVGIVACIVCCCFMGQKKSSETVVITQQPAAQGAYTTFQPQQPYAQPQQPYAQQPQPYAQQPQPYAQQPQPYAQPQQPYGKAVVGQVVQ